MKLTWSFRLEKMAWKAIKMRMLEFVLISFCISTFFTTRTNLNQNKLKQIRLSEFVFLFSPKPSQHVTFFVCRFASREAAMPTRTVGKTEAKQQGTHLAWCVCCVEKGKL